MTPGLVHNISVGFVMAEPRLLQGLKRLCDGRPKVGIGSTRLGISRRADWCMFRQAL